MDWWGIFGACHRVLKKPRTKDIRRYSLQEKDLYRNVYMLKIRDTKVEHELEFNPSWTSTKLSQGKCSTVDENIQSKNTSWHSIASQIKKR